MGKLKKQVIDKDRSGPLSGRDPEPDKTDESKKIIVQPGAKKKTSEDEKPSVNICLRSGEKLPRLIPIQMRDPKFILSEYRDLQNGKTVMVTERLAAYLTIWCDRVEE